jgi:hypothetical protein
MSIPATQGCNPQGQALQSGQSLNQAFFWDEIWDEIWDDFIRNM